MAILDDVGDRIRRRLIIDPVRWSGKFGQRAKLEILL
jgi:hypothetical protein